MKKTVLEECGSTNDEAWGCLPELNSHAAVLVRARRQTQGRGQHGRVWTSVEGNLMASLLVRAPQNRESLRWLPVAAGVAVVAALAKVLDAKADLSLVRLKWPNDIYFDSRKMGGVLCESRILGDRIQGAVIGLGLNIVSAPAVGSIETASLCRHLLGEEAPGLDRAERLIDEIIDAWTTSLLAWIDRLDQGQLSQLLVEWKSHSLTECDPGSHIRRGD